jgi:hypothetical protein
MKTNWNLSGKIRLVGVGLMLTCGLFNSGVVTVQAAEAVTNLVPLPALLVRWTFDEPAGSLVLRDSVRVPGLEARDSKAPPHLRGVWGRAIRLSGTHALATTGGLTNDSLSAITFSAWVRPKELSRYREIFRQESPHRLLFSFQNNGGILSLGLDIGGYVECDAPVNPNAVMDGSWHHCAATFDGRFMRVYLDGREIGNLARPGRIALDATTPAFIGSNGGHSEHFQGDLDELCLYGSALSAGEIAGLFQEGFATMTNAASRLQMQANAITVTGQNFAEAVAGCRRQIAQAGAGLDPDVPGVVQTRLKRQFTNECAQFFELTRIKLLDYLAAEEAHADARFASNLVALLMEYRPLTEPQWRKITEAERQQWKEVDVLQERYRQLLAKGKAAWFSPEWLNLMLAIGARIQHRPADQEAVAPYLTPQTPETRNLSATEARETLERDWLHQADQKPTPERIRQEIQWTRELAARLHRNVEGLVALEQQATALTKPDAKLYFQVREVKRRLMFQNPVVDFDQLVFVDMPFPTGKEWNHETRHRLGYMAVPGARLLVLKGLAPDGQLTQLLPQAPLHGSFWRPEVSWDATKVLCCFKPHNEKSFHLYEINTDGTGLRQLTDGPYDDLDPVYLPDGHILFSTTRGHTYVRCMPPTSA